MRRKQKFSTTLKPGGHGILLTDWGYEVMLEFMTCDFCHNKFLGLWYNNDGDNPIQLAISLCPDCAEGKLVEVD